MLLSRSANQGAVDVLRGAATNPDLILILILVSGVVFDSVSIGTPQDTLDSKYFPLMYKCEDFKYFQPITKSSYIYFAVEHLIAIAYGVLLIAESGQKRKYIVVTTILILHLIDFFLTYNMVWFRLFEFPWSMNTVGVFLYCMYYLNEKWHPSS